jgi:EAL domain-containing protein (putative c-di-GMP-specific phosphodiesterase class I)
VQDQLDVYYQPKLCLKTDRVLGAEALVRWCHPQDGFISPAEFIPVAEESGLITELGEWVLRRACEQATSWIDEGLVFEHVAVNVSGVQVQHAAFARSVREILASSGLPPRCLELEVTEEFLMKDAEASAVLLSELRELGISIAVDDFGTGYSSLAYLTRFPVDKLKIDRSFITEVCVNKQNAEISRAVINLGHSLSMKVVAEGIELERQLEFLKDEGCDEGQGYLFARPLPHDEFLAFLRRHAGHDAAAPNAQTLARS